MKATIESTDKVIQLGVPYMKPGADRNDSRELQTAFVPARIWEGVTESGVKFHAYITRVAVSETSPASHFVQFEKELKEQRKPSPDVAAIPLRLIL